MILPLCMCCPLLVLPRKAEYCIELVTVRGSNCPAPSWSRTVDSRKEEPRWGAALLFIEAGCARCRLR